MFRLPLSCIIIASLAMVESPETVDIPWHLDRIDQRSLPLDGHVLPVGLGYGVTIYVLDTGARITHEAFGDRAAYASVGRDGDLVGDAEGQMSGADDCHGHGTHMAALAAGFPYGVAPCSEIRAIRVANCRGKGPPEVAVRTVDWLTTHAERPAVVLMSLDYGEAPALRDAVARSIDSGLTYVVAAGGTYDNACASSPAGVPGAITVAASTREDKPIPFSNFGPCVDLFAPGKAILSADIINDTAVKSRDGTSPAAALVAGAAAIYLEQYPDAMPCDVETALVTSATEGVLALTHRSLESHTPNRLLFIGRD